MQEQNSSISNFRQFLARILLPLILIVSATGLLFNFVFEKKVILRSDVCGAYKVNRIINETHPAEIPIFGSSRAAYGYIPDSLGHNFFNYGLAGTNYNVVLFFLAHECAKVKTTPWVILNLDLNGLSNGIGDISNYILNANDAGVRRLLGAGYKGYFRIPFVKYFGQYEKLYETISPQRPAGTDKDNGQGEPRLTKMYYRRMSSTELVAGTKEDKPRLSSMIRHCKRD